jgi:vitamin B12/bleomycin/antimicrobial peptide transport system ATP-binding/permease protein
MEVAAVESLRVPLLRSYIMTVNACTRIRIRWRRFKRKLSHHTAVVKRFSRLGRAFLGAPGQRLARWLLGALLALCLAVGGLQVLISYAARDFMTALANRDTVAFYHNLWQYLGVFVLAVPVMVFYRYTSDRLSLAWRQWMTEHLVQRYFSHHVYYHLRSSETIDNPDQRISEDVKLFTTDVLGYLLVVVNSLVTLAGFVGVLWGISVQLTIGLLLYTGAGTLISAIIGRRLLGLYFQRYQTEADFRYGLVRVRDYAESIAFFRGERREHQDMLQRFGAVVRNTLETIGWGRNLRAFTHSYQYVALVVPALVVGPMYMRGEIEFGVVTQAEIAFAQVLAAVSVIVSYFESLSASAASVKRLSDLYEAFDEVETEDVQAAEARQIAVTRSRKRLKTKRLTVQTPDGRRTLAHNLSFELKPGERLLIMGESGSGKSSLLRTIAGLWQSGSGVIVRPPLGRMMFLPQRPYMVQGSLRAQLLYPLSENDTQDDEIREVLEVTNLAGLLKHVDNDLTQVVDWANVLSLGEQQRVSFARLLLQKPVIAFLDEATSALDEPNERLLYERLYNLGLTYVSISHRNTLQEFHDLLLRLHPNGRVELLRLRTDQREGRGIYALYRLRREC